MKISDMIRAASAQRQAKVHMKGPAKLNKYYEQCMKRYKNKEYCSRISWSIFCQHVDPTHPSCTKYSKKPGPPYTAPKAK